jgi:hypothetical protein
MKLQFQTAEADKALRCLGEASGLNEAVLRCKYGWVLMCALGSGECPLKSRNENSAEPMTALR